ncbi:uncharacterized protein A4U43_C05F17890 [Asparagus officinalis]|uniref:Uncharacterized protein n=1 Tax=Asparagus officinalis TaxID=4686 RepID=A0A5P1ESN1_ASPOF|nr:uncharacterized protein A4U43_C05F17890 [Asparagus officinalis]
MKNKGGEKANITWVWEFYMNYNRAYGSTKARTLVRGERSQAMLITSVGSFIYLHHSSVVMMYSSFFENITVGSLEYTHIAKYFSDSPIFGMSSVAMSAREMVVNKKKIELVYPLLITNICRDQRILILPSDQMEKERGDDVLDSLRGDATHWTFDTLRETLELLTMRVESMRFDMIAQHQYYDASFQYLMHVTRRSNSTLPTPLVYRDFMPEPACGHGYEEMQRDDRH